MRRTVSAIACLVVARLVACRDGASTEIVVGASSQMERELHAIRVVVSSGGRPVACATFARRDPNTVDVVHAKAEAGATAIVTVAGYAEDPSALGPDDCAIEGRPLIVRRHRTQAVEGQSLYLPMPLRKACADVSCADGQTCIAGECAGDERDPSTLVKFSDLMVRGDTSFCVSHERCFEDVVPALVSGEEDCTFQLPDWAHLDDHMNIEVLHADLTREILDDDPREGFTRLDESHFRIAPGLCKLYRARTIAALYVGANCSPKSVLAPLCTGGSIDAGVPERTLCTSGATLFPSRAALYLMVDRSRAMSRYFGPKGLGEPLDLLMRWPLLARSVVGLGTLPAPSTSCTSKNNPYATPQIALEPIGQTRPRIRALLEDDANLVPDGPLFLDAALRDAGSYAALDAFSAADFAHRQVVLVGNRDFGPHCDPTITAADRAYTAYETRGLSTSALVLRAPEDAPTFERDVYVDAVDASRKGRGTFADGIADDGAMRTGLVALAMNWVSCLYDLPESITPPADLSRAKLSYFDLISSTRVDLDREPACAESSDASGWNLEGRRVRVCGKACSDLRVMLSVSATYALERHFAPVDVPMKWSAPCP